MCACVLVCLGMERLGVGCGGGGEETDQPPRKPALYSVIHSSHWCHQKKGRAKNDKEREEVEEGRRRSEGDKEEVEEEEETEKEEEEDEN